MLSNKLHHWEVMLTNKHTYPKAQFQESLIKYLLSYPLIFSVCTSLRDKLMVYNIS